MGKHSDKLEETTLSSPAAHQAAQDILAHGYAVVRLDEVAAWTLHSALDTAVEFFREPLEVKMKHGSADHNYGYRPFGIEYSLNPERPDMNECFTLWANRRDLIPQATDIASLTNWFTDWSEVLAPLVAEVLGELAQAFGSEDAPPFEKASYLQMNYCLPTPPERDLLQDRHEDGHMVTVLHATAPGLELYPSASNEEIVMPFTPGPAELVIMPGSVLTALSGGRIEPLYHQVRNHGLDDRQSIMYFVNPEIEEPLFSWVADETGDRTDIREHVRYAPTMFGLPTVEVL